VISLLGIIFHHLRRYREEKEIGGYGLSELTENLSPMESRKKNATSVIMGEASVKVERKKNSKSVVGKEKENHAVTAITLQEKE